LLIEKINEKFDCVAESYHKWLFFYVSKPSERKNLFALIVAGRNTSNVIFRINPKTFKDNDKTRKVAGWFFPRGTERRMTIKDEDISEIIHYLEHSYSTTKSPN